MKIKGQESCKQKADRSTAPNVTEGSRRMKTEKCPLNLALRGAQGYLELFQWNWVNGIQGEKVAMMYRLHFVEL